MELEMGSCSLRNEETYHRSTNNCAFGDTSTRTVACGMFKPIWTNWLKVIAQYTQSIEKSGPNFQNFLLTELPMHATNELHDDET